MKDGAWPTTIDQIMVRRSVGDFHRFIFGVRDALRALSREDRFAWRDSAAKIYYHELIPLQAFLKAEGIDANTQMSVPCDGGPADAMLHKFRTDRSDQPLQITTASWDYDDVLRMKFLNVHRIVGTYSQISRNPRTGELIELGEGSFDREEVCDEIVCRVRKRIKHKIKKFRASNYDPTTWLIVQMADPGTIEELRSNVCSAAAEASADAPFERTYVVSPNDPVFSRLVWSRYRDNPT